MKTVKVILVISGILCIVSFVVWRKLETQVPTVPVKATATPEEAANTPKHPIQVEKDDKEPLPSLDQSDESVQKRVPELLGAAEAANVVIYEGFIRHFVVAIENAGSKQIPVNMSPIKTAPGDFLITGSGSQIYISEKNQDRYEMYMRLVEHANLKHIVGYYRRIYPLFQAAYEELGTHAYFNDKLVEVLDLIIGTPDAGERIQLKHPSVRYEFADPHLESLPAVQKIVLRMGAKNARVIKAKCQDLRQLLTETSN